MGNFKVKARKTIVSSTFCQKPGVPHNFAKFQQNKHAPRLFFPSDEHTGCNEQIRVTHIFPFHEENLKRMTKFCEEM